MPPLFLKHTRNMTEENTTQPARPSLFIKEGAVKRIELDHGFWMDVYMDVSVEEFEKAGVKPGMDGFEASLRTLMVAIKQWNLTDENGELAPCNVATLKRLPMTVYTKLMKEIDFLATASANLEKSEIMPTTES